jgi:hypothetical protein
MNYGDYSYIEAYPNGGRRSMPPTGVGRRAQMFEVWIRPVPRAQALFALRAALREVDTLAPERPYEGAVRVHPAVPEGLLRCTSRRAPPTASATPSTTGTSACDRATSRRSAR